jgi:hypothetical protein
MNKLLLLTFALCSQLLLSVGSAQADVSPPECSAIIEARAAALVEELGRTLPLPPLTPKSSDETRLTLADHAERRKQDSVRERTIERLIAERVDREVEEILEGRGC